MAIETNFFVSLLLKKVWEGGGRWLLEGVLISNYGLGDWRSDAFRGRALIRAWAFTRGNTVSGHSDEHILS